MLLNKVDKKIDIRPLFKEVVKHNTKVVEQKSYKQEPRTSLAEALSKDMNKNFEKYEG